jgi:hypothetical protein
MGNDQPDLKSSLETPTGTVFLGNGHLGIFDKCRNYTRARDVQAMGVYAYFMPISENHGPEVVVRGQRLVMVGSNNYLGLTKDPRVIEAAIEATRRFGSGCTGSRFLNGTLAIHEELEERLAAFSRREAALTMSTGYQTNQGVISTVVGKDDVIYCDRENHASIFEGCRLSYGQIRKFKHNDMEDLDRVLNLNDHGRGKIIVVDGVFSMSGGISNLPRIVELAKEHGAAVMVDDAHAVGVMGPTGRGTAEHFGLEDQVDLIIGTFSKSFGSLGGFVAGSADLIHYVKHTARDSGFGRLGPEGARHHGDRARAPRAALAERPVHEDGVRAPGLRHARQRDPDHPDLRRGRHDDAPVLEAALRGGDLLEPRDPPRSFEGQRADPNVLHVNAHGSASQSGARESSDPAWSGSRGSPSHAATAPVSSTSSSR